MNKRAKITTLIVSIVPVAMLALSFAAEPLYSTFCRLTGFGGTTQVATEAPKTVLDREVRVAFDANVAPGAPLKFRATQNFVDMKIGEKMMVFYEVTNTSDKPIRAMASYNVIPEKVGLYFKKIECFCFKEQTYEPGKTVKLPVVFFVDPDMAKDWQADDVRGITLSYTYFRSSGPQASAARLEDASAVN
jgi:cytochrome c oxidase assembly protein subunit 11